MAKAKKFGAFGGVFTPSVLTILGVIMYMRLGWVVGEAGLISALVIIAISHVISISTGLSISSVATDKKIKTGGIYYILSRSLGFPMGGAIGIALFIGTALSISLYLVGFSESFLSLAPIREFLHLGNDVNSYRIIGSLFLLILVAIAFISTSLAIKSQYFILTAIALSLVSIGIGFYTNSQLGPDTTIFSANENGESIIVIFGIFFPAVTGFTAGVAMSGDLKDPKSAIPRGTLAAIGVGFVIYVVLAIGFAVFVNRDLLLNDTNFLMQVAWWSPLVVAGIWGATLSSALGGILGGPRILQAISQDGITPKIFAKGYGASNEPRNALILIFVIAESGILIGELNVIAGIVSMFYLASYGFINLAFFLESWASTDFRPSFRVSRYFGLIGFIASFGVMFQLDMVSMFAALIIMFGIYAWLSRKQLQSEYGDVWQSVWLSIVRFALHKMDSKSIEQRNWQPNILLFSGGTRQRPHLMEFGKSLVGKYGMLSNFDLHQSEKTKYLFPKHLQSVPTDEIYGKGIFTRRQTCSDIYLGIETIVSTYGFSGIEPNTVLMGWARESSNPSRFVQMLQRLNELDMNLVLIDYDKRYGYGKYKTIDIWWRGHGQHGNFALSLMKFLWSSDEWRDAKLRLLVVNPVNDDAGKIREKASQVIDNLRISAEIKIINNQIEQKSFYDIIRIESLNSDLIVLGIPDIKVGEEEEFVKESSALMKDIGTVVLLKASQRFKAQNFGLKRKYIAENEKKELNLIIQETDENVNINLPSNAAASENILDIHKKLKIINNIILKENFSKTLSDYEGFTKEIKNDVQEIVFKGFDQFLQLTGDKQQSKIINTLDRIIRAIHKKLKSFANNKLETFESDYKDVVNKYLAEIDNELLSQIPQYQFYTHSKDDLSSSESNLQKAKNKVKYKVKYKKFILSYFPTSHYDIYTELSEKFGSIGIQYVIELQNFIKLLRNSILKIENLSEKNAINDKVISEHKENIKTRLDNIIKLQSESSKSLNSLLNIKTTELINEMSSNLKELNVNKLIKRTKGRTKKVKEKYENIIKIPEFQARNQRLLLSAWEFEIMILEFETKLFRIVKDISHKIEDYIRRNSFVNIEGISNYLKVFAEKIEENNPFDYKAEEIKTKEAVLLHFNAVAESNFETLKYFIDKFPEKIEIISNEAFNNLFELQFDELETLEIQAKKLTDFVVHEDLNASLLKITDTLPEQISRIENKALSALRLVAFSFFNSEGKVINPTENTNGKIVSFIDEQIKKLNIYSNEIEVVLEGFHRKINERLNTVSNKLSIYSLSESSSNFKQYTGKISKSAPISLVKNKFKQLKTYVSNQSNRLWYRHSEAVLFKQSIELESGRKSLVSSLHLLLENVSAKPEIIEKLPFFYKQMFIKAHNYNNEFWFGRKKELEDFETTVRRYKSGYYGGIAVLGEKSSGKTFFSKYAISKFLSNNEFYIVNAPVGGSTKISTLKSNIAKALGTNQGSFKRIFISIPEGSVILFDDAELWWEKSKSGSEAFEEIMNLIEEYSNRFLFILNFNEKSYRLINNMLNIESSFINVINLLPFNAEQLKEAVLFRHNSSGLQFKYKQNMQDNIRLFEYAKLFAKHFNISKGNIGYTLLSWISNVESVEKDVITIKTPKQPDTSVLDLIDSDDLILLMQFVLHKEIYLEKIQRISLLDNETIKQKLQKLKRSGLIIEEKPDIFEINGYLHPFILSQLELNDMI